MRKLTLLFILAISFLTLSGCTTKQIADIKTSDYVGEKVTVSGTVKQSIKIGSLSAYTLSDESGTIPVSTDELPQEGENVKVSGTLIKDTIFGYYIKAE